jgi:type IV pilus assembly protein PilY1
MNLGIPRCAGKTLIALLCTLNLLLALFPAPVRGDVSSMRNYCSTPPDVSGFKPNLLIMMDNSASMYDLAYTNPANYCLDDSADTFEKSTSPYTGYFDPEKNYSYNNTGGYFELSSNPIPTASCNLASTSYLCVNKSTQVNVTASGNFLNWLSTSKLDIEKKALTGGNYDTDNKWLQSETHGCRGKRFVKMVGNSPVSFAVRGPIPGETGYLPRAGSGGFTSIEVYSARFNKDPCTKAVTDWQNGAVADFGTAAQACLNSHYDGPPNSTIPSKGWVNTEIMSECFLYLAKGTALETSSGQLAKDCAARYEAYYTYDPRKILPNSGDNACALANLGGAWVLSTQGWDAPSFSAKLVNFCKAIPIPTPTDASPSVLMSGTTVNVPDFILDAGISSLGALSGTLSARLHLDSVPQGAIQAFKGAINFGAMVFNDDGSGSECSQPGSRIPCQCSPTDGGKIISYLNHSPLGDHSKGSGLIASLDAVTANSWTPLAESYYEAIGYFANRTDLRLQAADFDAAWPPTQFACQKNNILIVTDGMSTADRKDVVNDYVAQGLSGYLVDTTSGRPALQTTKKGDAISSDPPFQGSYNLDDLAWIARSTNIANGASPIRNLSDYLSTYVVYTGAPCGSYDAAGNCISSDEGVPEKMMQLVVSKGGGTMVNARNPGDLDAALGNILAQIKSSANSGTGASILSTGDSNGAVYLQEQFYPNKSFDGGATSASWIGEMQGLWYYIDPMITGSIGGDSTIREDTGGLHSLDLKRDRVVQFSFDPTLKVTQAQLFLDANGDGSKDPVQPANYPLTVSLDAVQSLWRAGLSLWNRDPDDRTIYTQIDGSTLVPFLDSTRTGNQALLQAADADEAKNIVSFARGTDALDPLKTADGKNRTVSFAGGNGSGSRSRGVSVDGQSTKVWKLGDIISSTPALQSGTSLGSYQLATPKGYNDASYASFTAQDAYKGRGTVYVGANDGMLHAFRLGGLQLSPGAGQTWPASQKASLSGGSGLGKEEWAFAPKNTLPYLGYLMDPNYSHLQYVDGSLTLADVSLGDPAVCDRTSYWNCAKDLAKGTNWRTVLIGGMGLGGAARGDRAGEPACSEGASGTCVKSPLQSAGFSSYFALDVTGQNKNGTGTPPTLLWEFSPPGLGFATSGAAIVKINARSGSDSATHDHDKNGRWFAVFASGPTGAVDPGSCQFQGKSDQNLKLFVLDLNALPPLVERGNYWVIDTGIPNAFGGSMSGAGIDTDRWNIKASGYYEDNALYLGYTQQVNPGEGWVKGGVLRLLTLENPDPGQWVASKVIDGIGPVTGAVAKLQDRKNHNLWLYFGTGRYFFNQDDMAGSRFLYGVKEPCYNYKVLDTFSNDSTQLAACSSTPLALADLSDATSSEPVNNPAAKGWKIGLDAAAGDFGAERLLTAPSALAGGSVFFTTFKPSGIPCSQGASYLWRVKYDSGWQTDLNGKAVVALSNGSSQELPLASWSDKDKRRGPQMTGRPGGVKIISNSGLKPLKKIIHIQER